MTVQICLTCQARFADEDLLALHCGRRHAGALSTTERAAFDDATRREMQALAHYQRHARAALKTAPMVFLAFMLSIVVFVEGGGAFAFMAAPAVLGGIGFLYFTAYSLTDEQA